MTTSCIVKVDRLHFCSCKVVPPVVMWYHSIGLSTDCHCLFIKFITIQCHLDSFSCSFLRSINF